MAIFDKPTPERPKVRLRMSPLELGVELIALAGIIANVVLFVYYQPLLPGSTAAESGLNVSALFMFVTLLPLVVYVGATAMGFFPRWFNYPVKITPDNAAREYRLAADMLRVIKAEVAVCMLIVEWVFINISMGGKMSLSAPTMIMFFALLVLTIVFFVYEMFKQK